MRDILLVGKALSLATADKFLRAAILKKIFKSLNVRFFIELLAECCMKEGLQKLQSSFEFLMVS